MSVLGLCFNVLVVGGYRAGFCEKMPEGFPLLQQSQCSWSKMNLLLAKAEPICDGDRTSGIGIFKRRKKKSSTTAARREE